MVTILVRNETMHDLPARKGAAILRERLPDHTIEFAASPSEEERLLPEADIIVGGPFQADRLSAADQLKLYQTVTAGVAFLDLDAFKARNIAVTNAGGVHGPNMAEHVLGWFLMFSRRLDEGIRRQERNEWRHFSSFREFNESRVGIIGLGPIGQTIVKRLEGFDVETVGVRYTPEKGGPTDEVYGFDELDSALVGTNYLAVACPLTETTEELLSYDEFSTLPHDAIVVNVARGKVIETDALVHALQQNIIHAAALDVTDPEPLPPDHTLWTLGNCLITPHTAGHTPVYWDRLVDIVEENVRLIESTGRYSDLRNQVV